MYKIDKICEISVLFDVDDSDKKKTCKKTYILHGVGMRKDYCLWNITTIKHLRNRTFIDAYTRNLPLEVSIRYKW